MSSPAMFRAYLSAPHFYTPPSPLNYIDVPWDRVAIDETGWFDTATGLWKPLAAGKLLCFWQVWDQAGAYKSQGNGVVAKLIGADSTGADKSLGGVSEDTAGIGFIGAYAYTSNALGHAVVRVASGDSWKVSNYCQASTDPATPLDSGQTLGQVAIDPNPAHTFWEAMFFPD